LNAAFGELRAAGVTTKAACALIGRPRATHYRQLLGPVHGPTARRQDPDNGQALTPAERDAVLALINTETYADLSIGQIWTRELDEGRYLCSMSTMYRIARAAGQSRERRRQATHPATVKPELCANGPSQVWSWDIERHEAPV
jgi:putative transposase